MRYIRNLDASAPIGRAPRDRARREAAPSHHPKDLPRRSSSNGAGSKTPCASTPTSWTVPAIPNANGLWNAAGGEFVGNAWGNWLVMDIDGDGKPDLVQTAATSTDGTRKLVPGIGASPYWNVYKGAASGFAATPTSWSVPTIPNANGLWNTTGGEFVGNAWGNWLVMDVDGDAKPDLVQTATTSSDGTRKLVPGISAIPYWNIYKGLASGFAGSPTSCRVPVIPNPNGLWNATGGEFIANAVGRWTLLDINGDGHIDLLITAMTDAAGTSKRVPGLGTSPHWLMHRNPP